MKSYAGILCVGTGCGMRRTGRDEEARPVGLHPALCRRGDTGGRLTRPRRSNPRKDHIMNEVDRGADGIFPPGHTQKYHTIVVRRYSLTTGSTVSNRGRGMVVSTKYALGWFGVSLRLR